MLRTEKMRKDSGPTHAHTQNAERYRTEGYRNETNITRNTNTEYKCHAAHLSKHKINEATHY